MTELNPTDLKHMKSLKRQPVTTPFGHGRAAFLRDFSRLKSRSFILRNFGKPKFRGDLLRLEASLDKAELWEKDAALFMAQSVKLISRQEKELVCKKNLLRNAHLVQIAWINQPLYALLSSYGASISYSAAQELTGSLSSPALFKAQPKKLFGQDQNSGQTHNSSTLNLGLSKNSLFRSLALISLFRAPMLPYGCPISLSLIDYGSHNTALSEVSDTEGRAALRVSNFDSVLNTVLVTRESGLYPDKLKTEHPHGNVNSSRRTVLPIWDFTYD